MTEELEVELVVREATLGRLVGSKQYVELCGGGGSHGKDYGHK